MKYHEFTPDPDALATRIMQHDPVVTGEPGAGASGGDVPKTLDALTGLRDATFVRAAYRTVLGRDADPSGLDQFVRLLRTGALDKVDVLGQLRYSPEGRRRAVDIPGLQWRYTLRRVGRKGGIGWVVRWVTALMRLPSMMRSGQHHQAVLEEQAAAVQKVLAELRDLRAQLQASSVAVQNVEGVLAELTSDTRALSRRLATYQERAAATGSTDAVPAPPQTAAPLVAPDADEWYIGFEDRFRGSREETKRAQEVYLPYVVASGAGTASAPVLDIGCGRGEWLELLKERGYLASGVDLNHTMVRENRERGLDVEEQDVLTHLAHRAASSTGMVTGFHLIEHLGVDTLVRLFEESRRVLRSGGCVVFETPNPENLVVGAYTFYFDPTHRHPLPPKTMEQFARSRGFTDVEILRLHPREEPGADAQFLDRWFRGPTDYAVIAWKDGRGAAR